MGLEAGLYKKIASSFIQKKLPSVGVTLKIKEIVSIALPFLLSLLCQRFGKGQISEESGNGMCDVKKTAVWESSTFPNL
jgi:hypothetical protein